MVDSSSFAGRDIISIGSLSKGDIDFILHRATEMQPIAEKGSDRLKGKILATLFFEPSTRHDSASSRRCSGLEVES